MDPKFHPAMAAITSGDLERLKSLLVKDPSLATARSSTSHPTLLQCLTLDAVNVPNKVEMARLFIDAGADIDGALGAAACINNVEVAALFLDCGADINGIGSWSPVEEALYWGNLEVLHLLLERGASVHNLRMAAGLGRIDLMESFFNSDGSLKPEAGKIDWPFGDLAKSNTNSKIKEELQTKITQWSDDRQSIINNALVYACMNNQIEAARMLLQHGAEINAIPPGFDYAGTALHNAAVRGHQAMVEFLVTHGANVSIKDTKVHSTPAGWADYGGYQEIKTYLERVQSSTEPESLV